MKRFTVLIVFALLPLAGSAQSYQFFSYGLAEGMCDKFAYTINQDQQAFDTLQRAVELDSSRTDAILTLSLVCLRNGHYPTAIELASAVAQNDPERAVLAWMVIGDACKILQKPDDALQAYGAAASLAPENSEIKEEILQKINSLK